jgi:imidazolonepropionase-like amidohydrolase
VTAADLLLVGGTLIDGSGGAPLHDAAVLMQGGTIAAVGTRRQLAGAVVRETIDVGGASMLPGFIDAHVHLIFSAGPEPLADVAAEDDAQLLVRARANAMAALDAGVTVVRDCGGRGVVVQQLRDEIAAGRSAGPRILSSGMPITSPRGHLHLIGVEARGTEAVREAVRGQVRAGADLIKVVASGGNLTPGTDPRQPQFSEAELRALVDEAHRSGRPVAAHVHSTQAIRSAVAAEVDTLEHCSWLGDGGLDETLLATMAQRQTVISPGTPSTFRQRPQDLASDPARQDFWRDLQEHRFRTTRAMHAAGLPMIFGTDAGAPRTRFADYALASSIYGDGFGLSPMEIIRAATGRAAQALGLGDELGTLEPGKRADVVVVNGDPSVDPTALRRVKLVIQAGRPLDSASALAGAG